MEYQLNFFADQRIQAALSTEKQWNSANLATCQRSIPSANAEPTAEIDPGRRLFAAMSSGVT
jgi:hypothetical protein